MSKSLRILVPVKRALDYLSKPRVSKDHSSIDVAGMKHSMNPFDEISVEEAVQIRDKAAKGGSGPKVDDIVAISAGPAKSADVLRTAMAMGADRGVHVKVDTDKAGSDLEPLTIAKLLKQAAQENKSNLVILGKQSIDDDSGQTGQMLAGLLGWSQATQASRIGFEDGEGDAAFAKVTREVDGGVETLRARLPLVVTTDLRLNTPRYATLPNIMKAKKKPLEVKSMADYGLDEAERRLKVKRVDEPAPRKGGGKVEDVDGMIGKLKELGAI